MSYEVLGFGYAWWSGDNLPILPPLPGFRAAPTDDAALVASLAQLDLEEARRRMRQANQAYVAYIYDEPVGYGWSSSRAGAISELGFEFPIPANNRYLWDFATLPAWRGQGVYPRCLQAILGYEQAAAQRFWIGHTTDNDSSRQGLLKAGFQMIEALVRTSAGALKILPIGSSGRAALSPMGLQLGVLPADECALKESLRVE